MTERLAPVKLWRLDGELIGGWLLLIGLALAGFGLQRALAHAPVNCRIESAYPSVRSDADLKMTVKAGMSCVVAVRVGDAMLDDLAIISRPREGTVAARGRTGITFRPERHFHGEDFFAFELRGKSHAREVDSIINVAVTVE